METIKAGNIIEYTHAKPGKGGIDSGIKRAKVIKEYEHFYLIERTGEIGKWKETILKKDIYINDIIIKVRK